MTLSEAPSGKPRVHSPLKLLVFAGTPPPVHGQAVMVAALLAALRSDPAFSVVQVDPRLSHDTADVGRWRPGKVIRLAAACGKAIRTRLSRGPMALYYVPAPGRRVPVFRDWIALACCRPFFSSVILHWHAVGLGAWTEKATALERWLTRLFLGRAALALVLAPELAEDAAVFAPKRLRVVPNGIPDPLRGATPPSRLKHHPLEVLFLGLGSEAKGLFRTMDAVLLANARERGTFRLTFAGAFASTVEENRFRQAVAAAADGSIHYAGFADEAKKTELLRTADVFCFPTTYAHEGQPLVLLEALAYDLPIITTRWRAIPSLLPTSPHVHYVDPERPQEIADALFRCRAAETSPEGELRQHFLANFTLEHHLRVVKEALLSLEPL